MKLIDRVCDGLAILAGIYLVAIMFGIVVSALARTFYFSGTWSSHVFTFAEFGLLYIVMAASPWLVREKGHVFIELVSAAIPKQVTETVQPPGIRPVRYHLPGPGLVHVGRGRPGPTGSAMRKCAAWTCRNICCWGRCPSVSR